jgi:hypothetical protein
MCLPLVDAAIAKATAPLTTLQPTIAPPIATRRAGHPHKDTATTIAEDPLPPLPLLPHFRRLQLMG